MLDFMQSIRAEVSRRETGTFVSIMIVEEFLFRARHRTGCFGADHSAWHGSRGKLFTGHVIWRAA